MFTKVLVLVLSLGLSSPLWAFTCYLTLAKASCWLKYNVTVDVVDANTSKKLASYSIPAGTPWQQQAFECDPAQKLMYYAQFNPVFWENDKGKTYSATRFWFLPGKINEGDKAWTIPVCFPENFAEVPFPPDATTGNCACDFSKVPVVKPQ